MVIDTTITVSYGGMVPDIATMAKIGGQSRLHGGMYFGAAVPVPLARHCILVSHPLLLMDSLLYWLQRRIFKLILLSFSVIVHIGW